GTRVRLGVRLRDLIDPTRDLRLVQALDEHVDVVGRPRTERHDAVGQRRIGGNRGTTAHGDYDTTPMTATEVPGHVDLTEHGIRPGRRAHLNPTTSMLYTHAPAR